MPNAKTFSWIKFYTDALCLVFPIRQKKFVTLLIIILKVSEYNQEIPQSNTQDQPTAPRGSGN